jgi:twitching motility protein PilT
MIDYLNESYAGHIITVEDPIEFLHEHKKSIINQRELGADTKTYATALKYALRQDPDVVLVGEMRDLVTMEAGLSAAETGHLVLGTMHTIGAANTIDRIIDQFPANQQNQIRSVLSTTLHTVISQALMARADGKGVVAAFEVMHNIPAIANLIRDGKTERIISTMQTSRKLGMFTLDDSLLQLYKKGLINSRTCIARAKDPKSMEASLLAVSPDKSEDPLV